MRNLDITKPRYDEHILPVPLPFVKYNKKLVPLTRNLSNTCSHSRGDWLGNPANIKVENNGAVVYVGSSLTVHNPLFSVHKL